MEIQIRRELHAALPDFFTVTAAKLRFLVRKINRDSQRTWRGAFGCDQGTLKAIVSHH